MSHSAAPSHPTFLGWVRRRLQTALVCASACWSAAGLAQQPILDAPAPGLIEAGTPEFTVVDAASIGLSSSLTDLHAYPDGRILILAGREIALGDGTRWEVFRLAPTDVAPVDPTLIVAGDGGLFTGLPGQFARIEFGSDGYWHRIPVAPIPDARTTFGSSYAIGDDWYWFTASNVVYSWSPDKPPRRVGTASDPERIFALGADILLSDRANGSLWRITADGLERAIPATATDISKTVTCGVVLPSSGIHLVGTHTHGLRRFDGSSLQPFVTSGPLADNCRINDLCATGPGLFAAAVNNLGLVVFDEQGRTVQTLDRSLDHRIARIRRLVYTPQGALWALLGDSVARIALPSPITYFEPLVSTGLVYSRPCRFEGRLWLLSDGQAQRAVYDNNGHLIRFEIDTPPGQPLCALSSATGDLLASALDGIYRRERTGWVNVAPGLRNAHLADHPDPEGRWSYFAEGAVGWIRPGRQSYQVHRIDRPETGSVYGAIGDIHGALWAELGTARIARFTRDGGRDEVRYFGDDEGLAGGWAQLSLIDGEIRATVAGYILRFAPESARFEPDRELLRQVPEAVDVSGRPTIDALGRLWLTAQGSLRVFEHRGRAYRLLTEEYFPPGIAPLYVTPQADGVVWLHSRLHLARFDPSVPRPPRPQPRGLITSVLLTNSNRTIYNPGDRLPPLNFDDNSLVAHFVAVDTPPDVTVTFAVRLKGAEEDWVNLGVSSWASFNRIKEGDYVLQVRPVAQGIPGPPVELALTVEPPWFRTRAAYAAYICGLVATLLLVGWYGSWRERRDKTKLALLVSQRTHELDTANRRLGATIEATQRQAEALQASEERYRQLNTELERRVRERTEALVRSNQQLVASNQELESFSYSISHDLRAPLRNINGFIDLLQRRTRGQLDAESLRFFRIISTETIRLSQLIDSLLAFARLNRTDFRLERISLSALVAQTIAELRPEFENRLVDWKIGALPTVTGDATLLRQVIANLLSNAIKFTRPRSPAVIEIGAPPFDDQHLQEHIVFVRDNGVGFDAQYTAKLFGVFQRLHHTRDFEGSGIGLANAKRIVLRHGGRMWAEGVPGEGATFYFAIPVQAAAPQRPEKHEPPTTEAAPPA